MKKLFYIYVLTALLALSALQFVEASDYFATGQITVNGHMLMIRDAAACWDTPDRLLIFFYPFTLDKEDAKRLESGFMADFTALANRSSPDPSKWDYCPYGMLEVSFMVYDGEKSLESIEGVILALFGFKPNYMTININRYGQEAGNFLDSLDLGHDESHGYVRLSIEGYDNPVNDRCSWKLSIVTRIFPAMAQQ